MSTNVTIDCTMTLMAAIKAARKHVSISGSRASWHVYGPYRSSDPSGPSTEITCDSYTKARTRRTAWRAAIALALMGKLTEETEFEVEQLMYSDPLAPHDLASVVRLAAKASPEVR
jgi:hypothetical protein